MRTDQFRTYLEGIFDRMILLTESKGAEYAHDDDQLANFRRLSERLGIPAGVVALVYLTKHMDAIEGHIRGLSESLSEPIAGRIDDALLYLILLRAIIDEDSGAMPAEQQHSAVIALPCDRPS